MLLPRDCMTVQVHLISRHTGVPNKVVGECIVHDSYTVMGDL